MSAQIIKMLESAVEKRRTLRRCTNALRLVNGRGDGLEGLVLEQYDRHFIVQIGHPRWWEQQDLLTDFVRRHFDARYLIAKDRTQPGAVDPQAARTCVWIEDAPSATIVEENSLQFGVDLHDTLNTGLFLDMRANRKLVAATARGRRVLNCFAYTCSFGVYCRRGGAAQVVNVDISRKNLDRGRGNYDLNRLVFGEEEFIRGDAVRYLQRAVKKDQRFDLVILDPPSFARHEGKVFSVKKDFGALIQSAVNILNPGGDVFVSTNCSEVTPGHLQTMVSTAAGQRLLRKIQRLGQDADFPGSGRMKESYLAALLVKF